MKTRTTLSIASIMCCALLSACSGTGKSKIHLDGAGATFPFPFYDLAFKTYDKEHNTTINYGAIGSGGGIRSLKDETVDFAASDAFLSDKEAASMRPVVHIPTCLGAVVPVYNLPGVKTLKLTGKLISDIYRNKITRWNDPAIEAVNPEAKLPATKIVPVYRSDGSGTTNVFSDYLSKVDEAWRNELGSGKSINWPTGIAAKGNPGVAGVVRETVGAIGYVGSEYRHAMNLPEAEVQNAAGKFVTATLAGISAAAEGEIPADTRAMITDAPASDAYPISCFTWIILYKEQYYKERSRAQAVAVRDLFAQIISPEGQALAAKINYAPLPASVVEKAKKQLAELTYKGVPLDK